MIIMNSKYVKILINYQNIYNCIIFHIKIGGVRVALLLT